ncbi:hypothetical protein BA895_20730 [Humibacillus sp. DSM 29435]|nr:hypothetical protein BA895_20730 [Humibacillus sp. DSM 29435]
MAAGAALPMPAGDAALLRARARSLRGIEAEARGTPLIHGVLAQRLPEVWAGVAADTAVAESVVLVGRAARVLEALTAAAAALTRYAATLELVRNAVAGLQQQWNGEMAAHTQAVATTRAQAVIDLASAHAVILLTEEHEAVKSRLSWQHAQQVEVLRAAAAAAARAVEAATNRTFPNGAEPTGTALRERLFVGMTFAEGAAAGARSRRLAVGDAAALRRVLGPGASSRSGGSSGQHLTDLLASMRGRAGDPVYAQVVVDELGVNGIQGLLAELSRRDSTASADDLQGVAGLLGQLLLTASNPAAAGLDPRTQRLVDSGSALLRDTVVASLGGEVADSAGSDRYAGYWLMGQLVTGARHSGWTGTIAPGFLQRLVTGTARAEVAETRDDDLRRRHGATVAPHGSDHFTSFFDDANRSGDALHVLLSEVGDDPVAQRELLAGTFDGGILTDTRGGPISVAAYLARRFVTYNANAPATSNDLHLATTDDLARLMRASSVGGGALAATLRGKVMAEIGRVSGYAQQGVSSTRQYEHNTAAVENQAVDWALAMHANVTRALNTPGLALDSDEYASPVGGDFQPVLSVGELSNLVGAFTLSTDFSAGPKAPAENYQRLMTGSVADARADAVSGLSVDDGIQRMAFFDASASWALIGLARRQDELNASMWSNLAEATNFVVALRKGPRELRDHVKTLVVDGSTKGDYEKLAISMVRSDVELKQSFANEQRTAALTGLLNGIRSTTATGPDSLKVLLKSGTNRLTPLPSAGSVLLARVTEIDAAVRAVERRPEPTPLNLTPTLRALAHGAQFVYDPLTGGSLDRSDVDHLKQHEIDTAERLMHAGHRIEFIHATGTGTSPDVRLDGELWEFKALSGSSTSTVVTAIRRGGSQSSRILVDATESGLPLRDILGAVDNALLRYGSAPAVDGGRGTIEVVRVILRDGRTVERRV